MMMRDAIPPRPQDVPTEGPGLSNQVARKVASLAVLYDAWLCDRLTVADAMVMGAVGVALEARGPREVAAELRKLADNLDRAAPRIEAAMRESAN